MAQLIISERPFGDGVILDLSGDIVFGEGNQTLRQAIRRLISEDKKKIFLNLEHVFYVDSSGIGELISALTAINREEDGGLKLLNLSERIYRLLEISKLLEVFEIYDDESLAAGGWNQKI